MMKNRVAALAFAAFLAATQMSCAGGAHILEQISPGSFSAVAHIPMPAGTNSVGTTWKDCYLASFAGQTPSSPVSRLPVGNGAGKISQSESNQIASGDVIEIPFVFSDDPMAVSVGDKDALIATYKDRAVADFRMEFVEKFKYYGYTRP